MMLEDQPRRNLHLAALNSSIAYRAVSRAHYSRVRDIEDGMVGGIEHFPSQLQVKLPGELEVPVQREIDELPGPSIMLSYRPALGQLVAGHDDMPWLRAHEGVSDDTPQTGVIGFVLYFYLASLVLGSICRSSDRIQKAQGLRTSPTGRSVQ